jgi:opacity protein-like surface antigen
MTLNDLAGSTQLFEGDGKIDTVSGMLNVIWDFTDLPSRCFTPYLGAGIGGVSANADFQINGQNVLGDGNDTSLAYQWIAGISVKTQSLSDLYVEYRYFAADSLHFNTTLPASAIIDGDGELEYRTSNVLFGFRKKF